MLSTRTRNGLNEDSYSPADKYLFSIVMSVYNVEAYIEEALESLEAQTIGFQEHIQVILVNDGSTDNSAMLCEQFQKRHPENVIYIEKENGGLSSARNAGLKYVEGTIVNFLDPDDLLSPNVCEEVWKFFQQYWRFFDFLSIPLVYFEGKKGLHAKYKLFGRRNKIVNLITEPYNFMLSSAASFYKREIFEHHSFDEKLVTAEDTELNTRLAQENPLFGYVCQNGVVYHYRRRTAGGSNVDKNRTGADTRVWTGITSVFQQAFNSTGTLKEFEKEIVAYELSNRLRDLRRNYFATKADYEALLCDYGKWIALLDDNFILFRSKYLKTRVMKALFLQMKGSSVLHAYQSDTLQVSFFAARIKAFAFQGNEVLFELLFDTFGCPLELLVYDDEGNTYTPTASSDLNSSFNLTLGEFELDKTHYRAFKLPLKQTRYSFFIRDIQTGHCFPLNSLAPNPLPPLQTASRYLAPRSKNGYKVILGRHIVTIKEDRGPNFVAGIKSARGLKKQGKPWARLRPFARKQKRYILIYDRPQKAGDNGQALFEYIMQKGPSELKRRTYFVLDKHCSDYEHLKQYGTHIVQPKSTRHKYLFLNASHIYSSHNARQFYLPFAHKGRYYADLLDYKFIWLQHGVTMNNISRAANRLATGNAYVISASEIEACQFRRPEYFLSQDQVCIAGFARFDKLENNPKKIIAFAPTWRAGLSGKILSTGYHEPLPGFGDSFYYQTLQGLLTNSRLLDFLTARDLRFDFVPHPGIACYEDFFAEFASKQIRIISQHEADYSKIFRESLLFITDYSSTAFDFAYLRKPVLYFQFDEEDFFANHYEKGYFDYRRDGFGDVVATIDELVSAIIRVADNDFRPEESYLQRINSFFAFNDQNNCKRILDATL